MDDYWLLTECYTYVAYHALQCICTFEQWLKQRNQSPEDAINKMFKENSLKGIWMHSNDSSSVDS